MLRAPDGTALGARFACVGDGRVIDGDAVFHSVAEVGPHAPDGSYARLVWDPALPVDAAGDPARNRSAPLLELARWTGPGARLEWGRASERSVVGRFSVPPGFRAVVFAHRAWLRPGPVALDPDRRGASAGPLRLRLSFPATAAAACDDLAAAYQVALGRRGARATEGPVAALLLGEGVREVSFTLSDAPAAPEPAPVAAALEAARAAYERGRARSAGAPAGAAEALTQNLHWMVLARPDTGRLYVPAGRRWLSRRADGAAEDWTIFEWDGFFNALLLSVEAPELAREMLLAVLETQYPNGNVPNYRSASRGSADRSQPPVGALCTLKLWGRLGGDRELLERAWMPLYAWHRWWRASGPRGKPRRDGNGNGLLEWGTDPATPAWEKWRPYDRARFESGMDDSPLWDDAALDASSGCLALDAVDLNSLYALDAWCLGRIAEELGRVDEASALFQEYEEVRGRMNRLLWDDVAGFYFDLHWEGRRSRRRAASSFYPLLAGIPTPDRAARMIERLRDPRQFWGEHVLPTISRDDRAFEQQQYWRGTIWPPTNYLVTLGLRRYGYEEEAAALAAAGARLFLESWRRHGLCRENHDARTGAGGGHRFQSWGPLFVLSALEEAADWDPWGGVRFGSFGADAAEHTGLRVGGHAYELRRGPDGFELRRDGAPWLRANVPAAITGLSASDGEVRFQTRAPRAGRLTIGDRELELPAGTRDWKLPDTLSAR